MTIDEAIKRLDRNAYRTTCYGNRVVEHEENLIAIQALEKQINGCWVPCKDRLPEDDSICIVTVEYPNNETMVDYGWFDRNGVCWFVGMHEFRTSNVLAWQPLQEPFKERD